MTQRNRVHYYLQGAGAWLLPVSLALSAVLVSLCPPVHASSLWAGAGSSVEGGGVLVGKNYDGQPAHCELRMVIPKQGITYLGLFPLHGRKGRGPLAGINERGLAVVSAAPETLSDVKTSPSSELITEKLLTGFDSVDALLSAPHVFKKSSPLFYVIADRQKIALVEIPPQGEPAVTSTQNGVVVHTNHYVNDRLLSSNKRMSKGSELRFERINRALNGATGPLTMDDFVRISKEKGDGPEDAILRLGAPEGTERTLASWVLMLPRSGAPELHAVLFGADDTGREFDVRLDQPFWTEGVE